MALHDTSRLEVLAQLAAVVSARKDESADTSYTASLLHKGVEACAKKFGEEAFELALASASGDKDHITAEAGDVVYHLMVLLEAAGVDWDDVCAELARRQGISGHEEKASRSGA